MSRQPHIFRQLEIDETCGVRREGATFREIHDLAKEFGIPEISLWGVYRAREATQPLVPHTHDTMEICHLRDGQQTYTVAGRDYTLNAGDVFITRPGERHHTGGQPQERGALFWTHLALPRPGRPFLGLTAADAAPLVRELRNLPRRFFPGSPVLTARFGAVWEILRETDRPLTPLRLRAELVQLLLELVRNASMPVGHHRDETITAVLDHIEAHLDRPLTVPDLAKVAGLTPSWFKARFRKETGTPPAEYVMRRKIQRAKELLSAKNATVTGVARRLGFSSSQYFATVFRRHTGQPPSAVRPG